MRERALPGFDGVGGEHRIPVKPVDWETAMINCRKNLRDEHTLDTGLRAEIQGWQGHGHMTFYAAAKGVCGKIGNIDAVFVQTIVSGAAQATLPKDFVV